MKSRRQSSPTLQTHCELQGLWYTGIASSRGMFHSASWFSCIPQFRSIHFIHAYIVTKNDCWYIKCLECIISVFVHQGILARWQTHLKTLFIWDQGQPLMLFQQYFCCRKERTAVFKCNEAYIITDQNPLLPLFLPLHLQKRIWLL